DVLKNMGCEIIYDDEIIVKGPEGGALKGITVSMSDFSDQALTLAAIAPFCDSPVEITGIGHIRKQESDRISVIKNELEKIGIKVEEGETSVKIYPGNITGGVVNTYNDHRVAMSFTLTGLRTGNITIENPLCCKKTFENYFEIIKNIKLSEI
ncbi:MAG: 3-phosphoshikimate 1-carboxyvinyltransferase, partial [Lachnospiraceae bacterium]|nr:3-phosphoshikimate 1-carboxyvinyltransferase [Lachnospiraceae bacterium]